MEKKNHALSTFQLVLFSFILFFGTLFNSFAIWVFCFKMKKWTETRVFMMSLLFSDCCLLVTIPFRIYATQKRWDLGQGVCSALSYAYFMNTYLSIAIITLISVDRYIGIKFPIRSRSLRSPKKATLACAIVFVLLLSTRIFIYVTSPNVSSTGLCFRKSSTRPLKRSLYFTILGFYIPMPIIIFCSVKVIRFLKLKEKTSVNEHKCIQKSIKIVSANLAIFLICFLPLHIGNIIRFVVESLKLDCSLIRNVNDFVYAAQTIGDLNCCLDCISYYFVAREFWETTSSLPKISNFRTTQDQAEESNL